MRRHPTTPPRNVILFLLCAWCCTAMSQQTLETDIAWERAAMETHAKFNKLQRRDSEYIPLSCWAEPIRNLDPLYVYHHRVNIVVVLKRTGETEEGVYIQNMVSSFIMSKEVDGFSLRGTDEAGLRHFIRQRSIKQRVDGTRP